MTLFNEQDRKEQVETAGRQIYIFYVLRARERERCFVLILSRPTNIWSLLQLFIKWTSRLWNKNSKRRYLEKVMGKNWLVHINLEQVIFHVI